MKTLWNFTKKLHTTTEVKMVLFLSLITTICCMSGFFAWYLIHFYAFNTISWAICFTGYPGFFAGLLGGILYLYRYGI